MAANDETAVDEQRAPTNVERLADFILAHVEPVAPGDTQALDEDDALNLAHAIFSEFLRTDVDAQNIFATPGVDVNTLEPFAMVMWGPMAGRLSPLELRVIGAAFLETAETAEVESAFVRWLMREDGSNIDGAVKILQSFRQFRAGIEDATVPE